jgi:hypothetical protein
MVLFLRISLGGFGGEQHDEVKYRGDHFEDESFK